jgi:cbb3-type cytochrome oxidase maturation protein
MNILFFMIGVSLLMALGFLTAFFWSMRSGQHDDLYTPSMRMLLDDDDSPATSPTESNLPQ